MTNLNLLLPISPYPERGRLCTLRYEKPVKIVMAMQHEGKPREVGIYYSFDQNLPTKIEQKIKPCIYLHLHGSITEILIYTIRSKSERTKKKKGNNESTRSAEENRFHGL